MSSPAPTAGASSRKASSRVGSPRDEHNLLPQLSGRDLNGERYELPEDLNRRWNFLIAAFRREQQELVDGWLGLLLGPQVAGPHVAVYEIPILSLTLSPVRSFIDGGMARGVGTDEARARTITVYTSVRRVLRELGLDGTDTIAVLLVERSGRIVARESGACGERKAQRLLSALAMQDANSDG